ncbi:MAG: retron system putative HNH endonuclease [Byssovorax sp.]
MRPVQRGPEPPDLTAFKAAANAEWTPRYRDLDKRPVRAALAREQGYLCGYCGSRIGQREGDCHIEHVEAQSTTPSRELDYTNMLASCQGSEAKPQVPEHCGQARGNAPLPVTPFLADCGEYFSYGSDGSIGATSDPAKNEAADRTLRILRLGVDRLKSARAAAIEGAIEGLDGLSSDEWRVEAGMYDVPDRDGRLAPFCFAIQQVLSAYA